MDHLNVCLVSRGASSKISYLQVTCSYVLNLISYVLNDFLGKFMKSSGHSTYAAVGSDIVEYERTQIVHIHRSHQEKIISMALVGNILLSYDSNNCIKVKITFLRLNTYILLIKIKYQIMDVKSRSIISEILSLQSSKITFVIHPYTYLNKFLIGYESGDMELWNIRKKTLIYTFQSHLDYFNKNFPNGNIFDYIMYSHLLKILHDFKLN